MRALSLFLVFALAKSWVIAHSATPATPLLALAWFWQDAAAALLFAAFDFAITQTRFRRLPWVLYAALAIYATINIPVERAVFTPLTWPMLRAAGGPLADSFRIYLTWQNSAMVALTLAAAIALPWLLRRLPATAFRGAAAAGILLAVLGPAARVYTLGLDRNVLAALIATAFPRVAAHSTMADFRTSRFPATASPPDLSWLAGIARGRNIVMVSLESTAAQYLPMYGGDPAVAPHLAVLARNAVVFDAAYAAYPESIKGLFSILCSTFPAFDSDAHDYASVPCRSLPQILAGSGYRTALFHSGRFNYLGMQSIIRNRGFETLEDAGDIGGNHQSSFGVDEPSTVARILSWVDAQPKDQPFFLTYLPIAGHHPYETADRGPFPATTDRARYLNAIHYGDASLGALIEGIRSRGLFSNTVWVIFGDHGEAFGQHAGNYGHTFYLYDENVHVPLIIAAPAIRGQIRTPAITSLVDVAPSTLELAGISVPAGWQGRSVLDPTPRMALFFADYSLGLLGLRDGPWKFTYEIESGRSQVFNLECDPAEQSDLASRETTRADWYRTTLRAWSGAQRNYLLSNARTRR
jgi:arylsulfatase A-like enzyme